MDKIKDIFERYPRLTHLYFNEETGGIYFHEVQGAKRILRRNFQPKENVIKKTKKQK